MGLCASNEKSAEEKARDAQAKKEGKKIDQLLNADRARDQLVNKLLLLGAGGSGKSTLFKQMNNLYGNGYTTEDRKTFRNIIYNNIIISAHVLIKESETMVNERGQPEYAIAADLQDVKNEVLNSIKEGDDVNEDVGNLLKKLWADAGIQLTYKARASFQLNDSTEYFFERLDDMKRADYIPSEQDVLRSRVPTTGIVENSFEIEGSKFQMYDVGGQRSERKKWIHCFENVTAVLFVCAISAYNQFLYEDDQTNRMKESLKLFEEIANAEWFKDTSMILFLNKRDLFEKKIHEVPLADYFPEYQGPNEPEPAREFIRLMFEAKNERLDRQIYTHFTTATDTDKVNKVFTAVKDIVIKKGLARAGLM